MKLSTKLSTQRISEPVELMIFDLDGTLTDSKSPLDGEMADLICGLLTYTKVAVISGASFAQFDHQFLLYLERSSNHVSGPVQVQDRTFANLSILPANGSSFYRFGYGNGKSRFDKTESDIEDEWKLVYQKSLLPKEKKQIKDVIREAIQETEISTANLVAEGKLYGEQLEDRDSQMTFSAFGQQAPIEVKKAWDPDYSKRKAFVAKLRPSLPDFEINIGGMTSIDITKKGMDKEHGIDSLAQYLSIPKSNIIYVGDALFPGGNDYGAVNAGIQTYSVTGISDTKELIRNFINAKKEAQK